MSGLVRRLLVPAAGFLCAAVCAATPDFAGAHASDDARYAATRVLAGADQRKPFAIVDKKGARIYVFDPAGRLAGTAAALLGAGPGDASIPDIAGRSISSLAPEERTTPAGRFESAPGRNDKGEEIVWIDYTQALAIHRLRPAAAHERRAARLASPTPGDNRISAGCIVVSTVFYDTVIAPLLGSHRGVVYVLPEASPVQALFDVIEVQ